MLLFVNRSNKMFVIVFSYAYTLTSTDFLKLMPPFTLSHGLTIIFRESFRNSEVPEDGKLANVTPVHKKGPKSLGHNYRPITLTSQPCRVMETILKEDVLASL